MKILAISNIFPPHIRGGYELGALEILKRLKARGHTVILATSDNHPSTIKANYDLKNLEGLDIRRVFLSIREYDVAYDRPYKIYPQYAYEKNHRFGGYVESNCIALNNIVEVENPDIIYFFNPLGLGTVGLLELALSYKGKRMAMHMMDNIDAMVRFSGEMIGTIPTWERIKGRLHTVACSNLIEKVNQEKGGKFASCTVLYNSLDTSLWAENALRNRPSTQLRLVYWGQVTQRKGVGYLVDAVVTLKKRRPDADISLDIFGPAEKNEEAAIVKKIQETGTKEIIKLKGFIDQKELREKLSNYDAGVFLLDDAEPFAYAPIESVLAGLYTVFPRKVSAVEIFGESPLTVKNREDAQEVSTVLENIMAGSPFLEAERRRMIDTARQHLDIEKSFIPSLVKLLENLPANEGADPEATLNTARDARFPPQAQKITDFNYPQDLTYLVSRLTKRLMFKPKLTAFILYVAEKFFGLKK